MIWQDPWFLWFLLLIPALAGGLWWYRQRSERERSRFFSSELFKSLRRGYWPVGESLRVYSLYAGLFFLIIAIAGPKIGTEVREVKRQGVDLLIALDLSASMNVEDVKPSRLEKAKYEIGRLVDRLQGDRVGLVVFTGDAYLQAPMTLDYSALRMFLNISSTEQMPSSTTDFSAAMETALQAFKSSEEDEQESSDAARVMLIVSDGEDQGNSYDEALEALTAENVSIYTLGIGTRSGGTIPLYNEQSGDLIGYKRDSDGQVVTSKLQPDVLRSIADKNNGRYYEINRGSDGLDSFLARIGELQQGEFSSQEYADFKNQYQWIALVALVFMIVSQVIPNYRKQKDKAEVRV